MQDMEETEVVDLKSWGEISKRDWVWGPERGEQ